jgi:DNA-binding CsgD family transcriptional regulator
MEERSEQGRLALDALTVTLGLSAWVALGSLVLAIADGLGEHPARRAALGALLLAACVLGLLRRGAVEERLRRQPWLVVVVAAAQILAAVLDEPIGGAYVAFSLTSIGLAVVAARTRTVWLCVAVLEAGFLAAVLSQHSLHQLAADGELGGVVGVIVSYPVIALLLLTLRRLFTRFSASAETIVLAIRAGAPVLTPALAAAVAGPRLLSPGRATALTPAEVRAVEALASGRAPKQIALDQRVSLSTVRTHLKHAKRKTGARTLRELAALAKHPDWPRVTR